MNSDQLKSEMNLRGIQNYMDLDALRKDGIYVWAFPIIYREGKDIIKTEYGWEYELADGRTAWYNEPLTSYENALSEGIKQAKQAGQ